MHVLWQTSSGPQCFWSHQDGIAGSCWEVGISALPQRRGNELTWLLDHTWLVQSQHMTSSHTARKLYKQLKLEVWELMKKLLCKCLTLLIFFFPLFLLVKLQSTEASTVSPPNTWQELALGLNSTQIAVSWQRLQEWQCLKTLQCFPTVYWPKYYKW